MIYNMIEKDTKINELDNKLSNVNTALSKLDNKLSNVNTALSKYVIINPIVTSVVGQNYIDIVLANTGSASAPIAMIMDVLSDSYYIKGMKFVDSSTYTWRVFFNTEFTASVNFRLAIHYKRVS